MSEPTIDVKTPGTISRENLDIPGVQIPGVSGMLPANTKKVYVSKLTPGEKRGLEALGIDTANGIPSNLAEIIEKAQREAQSFKPPVGPDFKPEGEFKPIPIENLSPDVRAKVLEDVKMAMLQAQADALEAQKAAEDGQLDPSVQAAVAAAEAAKAEPTEVEVVEEESGATHAGDLLGESAPANCPHCGWDMRQQEDITVPDNDIYAYMASFLGDKGFEKSYLILGGKASITFRELTMSELDAIYAAVDTMRSQELLKNQMDVFEMLNRLRMLLQIRRLDRPGAPKIFPASLTEGEESWKSKVPEEEWKAGRGLLWIENHLKNGALRHESVFSGVRRCAEDFNRLLSKLEARMQDENFYKPTAEQS